jgi:hypothetical protein
MGSLHGCRGGGIPGTSRWRFRRVLNKSPPFGPRLAATSLFSESLVVRRPASHPILMGLGLAVGPFNAVSLETLF